MYGQNSNYFTWGFDFHAGSQISNSNTSTGLAIAVRSGLLESVAVPEPSTCFLLGIGLCVVGYVRRKLN